MEMLKNKKSCMRESLYKCLKSCVCDSCPWVLEEYVYQSDGCVDTHDKCAVR